MAYRSTLREGDELAIGEARILVHRARRGEVRLSVEAPRQMRISRSTDLSTEPCAGMAELPPEVIDELHRLDHAALVPCHCRKAYVLPGTFCPQCIGDGRDLVPMRPHNNCDDIPF